MTNEPEPHNMLVLLFNKRVAIIQEGLSLIFVEVIELTGRIVE
jgi:hypothetical protein